MIIECQKTKAGQKIWDLEFGICYFRLTPDTHTERKER
ncbi:Uncharacterized protein dnm_043720 [Desulfonema magnum]|uniref:Uncharacterized protein n=1 Tax=Desulfonema magnum TaxID=45655 RepID=A0A975BNN3_9BACT|nr:Uncharacterized protein dnm_043720 [Desulfonema magnum]